MTTLTTPPEKIKRDYLPEDFKINTWEDLKPYFEELKGRELKNRQELEAWLKDMSEMEAVISEDASWRQIKMTCDTTNKDFEDAFTYFCMEIEPKMKPYFFELNKKLLGSPYLQELDKSVYYPYLRSVENAVQLYREENVPIQAELSVLAQNFGVISGKMTVTVEDKEYTLQQA